MASDLRSGARARVTVEASPDGARGGRQPDLVVETPNAILLLENKILAAESGADQYSDYLSIARDLADGRAYAAVLLARHRRELPAGWSAVWTHRDLAEILEPLWEATELPPWTRVLVALVVTDLRHEGLSERYGRIEELLRRTAGAKLSPLEVRRLTRLVEDIPEHEPWETP